MNYSPSPPIYQQFSKPRRSMHQFLYVCIMSLQKLKAGFVAALKDIYETEEAVNIFNLTIENLTGINTRQNSYTSFQPDGCFIKMFNEIQHRLLGNEPIQYILNEAWFYDLPFWVNASVLVPRPETEELVDWVIKDHQQSKDLAILDIGTGSGCIPIILKKKIPRARVASCDVSAAALEVARKNARKHQTDIHFIECDFLKREQWSSMGPADVIISNPPYIPQSEKGLMHPNVLDHEPHLALFVDDSEPLIFYSAIAEAGKILLNDSGLIYVEIFEGLGNETLSVFRDHGYDALLKKDMQGKERFIKARRP